MFRQEIQTFTAGNPGARPIIFIHGFPFDHHMWDKQINELKADFYCFTYDIRGLGVSPAGDGQFTIESFVDDLEYLINKYKLEKPALCGLSMGGYIALRSIERMENKFGALILCDSKSEPDTDEGKLKRADGIKKINAEGIQKFINGFVPNCFAESFIKNSENEYNEVLSRALNSDPIGVKGCLLAMQGRTDTTSYLTGIKIPVLVICGEEDKFSPPVVMKSISEKIKDSDFSVIPHAGHMSPVENHNAFNRAIAGFLKNKFK